MKYYNLDINKVLEELKSSNNGLSNNEAKKRLAKDGKNKIREKKKESNLKKFLNEFKNLMIVVLIIAAIVSFFLAIYNNESYIDSIIILAIVILNAFMGFFQELKAAKEIDSLKKLQVTNVKVKRNNQIHIINSEDLVVGDIILLEAGDTVPADARIISVASLKVDESTLTGESVHVEKVTNKIYGEVAISERINMVFSGTSVTYGKCQAVVCKTGINTELGKIAENLNSDIKEVTPLQKKISGISKFLSIVIVIIIIIMFVIGISSGMNVTDVVMLSISLAVAAIPEGLPAVITIILSLGMGVLAKKNAIVRKMSSVETLGSTEVICSDKTGTITQNKMSVREIYYNGAICNIESLNDFNILFKSMLLNNDASKNNDSFIGDATEVALLEAIDNIIDINNILKMNKRIDELPFDSDRKMMSTINKNKDSITMYTKGSFDSVIKKCKYIYLDDKVEKLTKKKLNELKEIETLESNKAYRILAFAYKKLDKDYILDNGLEDELIFVGMVSMIDPPRKDVKEAIEACISAHIKPVMITGDSLSTACAIAQEIGILNSNKEAITGVELDKMSEKELKEAVSKYSVYARVSPTNKLQIVKAWKDNSKVVAMTGDGVNDAPALKSADIGVGMGITGTEVSKGVSDIVLTDDSFSTIVIAVKEGRRIFDNIRKVLVYLLSGNITEILVVFFGMIFGVEIFLPLQLLYINLVTDGLPAIALAFEKEEPNIMNRDVRKKDSSFFTQFLIARIGLSSIFKTCAILLVYLVNLKLYGENVAMTVAFLTLILLEMIYSFSCRNIKNNVINKDLFSNKILNKSIFLLIVLLIIIFISPIKNIFNVADLSVVQVMYSIILVIIVFLLNELSKKIVSKIFKD